LAVREQSQRLDLALPVAVLATQRQRLLARLDRIPAFVPVHVQNGLLKQSLRMRMRVAAAVAYGNFFLRRAHCLPDVVIHGVDVPEGCVGFSLGSEIALHAEEPVSLHSGGDGTVEVVQTALRYGSCEDCASLHVEFLVLLK